MTHVAVLLSTYNGTAFVAEQIESVLGQEGVGVTLLVRDDGSTDGTLRVLERWGSDRRVRIFAEANLGVVGSFFRLLELAGELPDYFAFCDQDDVWHRDKLRRAVEVLERADASRPQLYACRVTVTREDLRPLGVSRPPVRPLRFENAVVENVVTGCTAVFNRRARALVLDNPHAGALIHDWWIYLAVSAFGEVHYDPTPRMLYRQHSGNVIGAAPGVLGRWSRRLWLRITSRRMRLVQQIEAFRANFGPSLTAYQREVLDDLILASRAGLRERLRIARSSPVYRQATIDNLVLRALLACGFL